MSVDYHVDLDIHCDKCGDGQNKHDSMYCGKCAGIAEPKGPQAVNRIVEKVRWIGDELRDKNIDWRIVERVRELEQDLLA